MSADLDLSGLQIQGLLAQLAGFDDLNGVANLKTQLTASGLDANTLMASLNGTASGELINGSFKGIAVDSLICDGVATALGGQSKLASGDTAFDAIDFNTQITNGVADFDRLNLGLANLVVAGQGRVNLPQQTLDLNLGANLSGDSAIQGCSVPSFLSENTIPVRCQGGFNDDPLGLCKLDSSKISALSAAEDKAKAKLEQAKADAQAKIDQAEADARAKLETKKTELRDKAEDKVKDKLKSLFN